MHPDSAIYFAAGFGRRMAPLTDNRPKPLIEVAGKALLDHALDQGTAYGMANSVVNTHYLAEMIDTHLQGRKITTIHETPEILETGGGLRNALPALGSAPVFTMNTDAVWHGPNVFKILADAWDPKRMDGLLLLVPPTRMVGHRLTSGFDLAPDGQIYRAPALAYTGVQILKTDGLSQIPERAFSLNLYWDQLLKKKSLFGVIYPGHWCDVGRPDTLPLAEAVVRGDV